MIKKGLKVKIIAGKDKNKEGEVIEIDRKKNRAKIKDVNIIKKHVKTCENPAKSCLSLAYILLEYCLNPARILLKSCLTPARILLNSCSASA